MLDDDAGDAGDAGKNVANRGEDWSVIGLNAVILPRQVYANRSAKASQYWQVAGTIVVVGSSSPLSVYFPVA